MKFFKYLALFAITASLFNCSPKLSPFTKDLQVENGWDESDLKKIQFYVSKDIVLHRDFNTGNSKIIDGKVRVVNGKKVEEIVIEKGTPGVLALNPKSDRIAVAFESGGDERYLMFGPSPKAGGRYVLLAKEWRKSSGVITYNGKEYRTDSDSAFSALMIDLKQTRKTEVRSRVAKGRKI